MNEKQITDTLFQHTQEITALTRKVNEIEADLQIVRRDQSKIGQLIEEQIKTNYEITHIKEDLKSTNSNIVVINQTLKNIESSLIRTDVSETIKKSFKEDLRKYLPLLLILCGAMFILGIVLDDTKIIHTIFGKWGWLL